MRKQLLAIVLVVALLTTVIALVAFRADDGSNLEVTSSSDVKKAQPSSGEADDATQIDIENFAYSPKTVTIKKGTTLTWTNKDSVAHTVTGEDGGPDSSLLNQGESYGYTFNEVGSFAYFCKPHPTMQATVIVTD